MKKCFSDPAVFKQLETDCYNAGCKGQVIDCSEFPAAEYRYFARLCGVYAMFKSKAISLEQAAAEKQRLLSQYNEDIKQRFLYVDACRKHQEAIKATESLCAALCKAPLKLPEDVTEALRTAIDAVKRNETVVKAIKGAIKICTCDIRNAEDDSMKAMERRINLSNQKMKLEALLGIAGGEEDD